MNRYASRRKACESRRYTMETLALLGFIPRDFPPRIQAEFRRRLTAVGRTPILVEIDKENRRLMIQAVEHHLDVLTAKRYRHNVRALLRTASQFAVAIEVTIRRSARLTDRQLVEMRAALISSIRHLVECVYGWPRPNADRAEKYGPALFYSFERAGHAKAADELAALLRAMYRVRTMREWMADRPLLVAGVFGMLTAAGCVAAR